MHRNCTLFFSIVRTSLKRGASTVEDTIGRICPKSGICRAASTFASMHARCGGLRLALSWNASASTVSGYNIYRSTVSGGGYARLNSSLVSVLAYTDSTIQSGTTYYYVTTAVDANGVESTYSNEISAAIP